MRIERPKAMSDGRSREVNAAVIQEYRANGGEFTTFFAGSPILLLNHRGAKSGSTHTSPLVYTRYGEAFVVVASMGGAPVDPQWYRNLLANPVVAIEVGAETITVTARVATGGERMRLYGAHANAISNFNDYQARTTREIPVIVLDPSDRAADDHGLAADDHGLASDSRH